MIDLILASCIGAAFYGGFKAGNKFKTIAELFAAAKAKVVSAL